MKKKSKKIIYLEKILRFMAVITLRVHKPRIIGITGSVGKTSAKEAIFLVLKNNFKTRKNEENYNNEIGIPLTIIGAKTGGNNPIKWFWVILKWFFGIIIPFRYPKILVLEMAIDRPGDMKYLVDFISSEVAVLTDISASHLEFFNSVDEIAKEKSILVKSLSENGVAILNVDNKIIGKLKEQIKTKIIDFGIKNKAKIFATDVQFGYDEIENKNKGLSFKLNYGGNFVPIRLPYIIAEHQLYAVLIAIAVGNYFKINLVDVASFLEELKPSCGRMTLIEGMKNSLIIDDTYNASPVSTMAAIETIEKMRASRRVVILGDMLELGEFSEAGHRKVIEKVFDKNFDIVIFVGSKMKKVAESILADQNFNKKIVYFDNSDKASLEIEKNIRERDIILVKGSQSMRMEKIVAKLMSNTREAKKLLCRQSRHWKSKKFIRPAP